MPTALGLSVPVTGFYEITYSVSYEMDALAQGTNNNQARTTVETVLTKSDNEIIGTKMFTYHRNVDSSKTTASKTIIIQLNQNDAVNVKGRVDSGGGEMKSIPGACNFTIKLLK